MTAFCMTSAIWLSGTITRFWSLVRIPSGWPWTSVIVEFFASRKVLARSSSFTSAATAIIMPKTVETAASRTNGTSAISSRSFFTRGRTRGDWKGIGSALRSVTERARSWGRGGGGRRPTERSRLPSPPRMTDLARHAVDVLPAGELERKLELGRPLRVKLGVDPTSADIHLGHTVVLNKLRE